jgi:hypothetical protein
MLKIFQSLIPILVCSLAVSVFAGPDWDEGAKDAGSTPATSQPVSAPQPRVITKIRGTTSVALVGVSDLVDMYLIKTGNAESLNNFIVQLNSEGTPWNARLSLFKKVSVSCDGFTSVVARPIATVVKFSSAYPYPIFFGNSVLAGSTSGATLKSLLQANTEYFLAVSGANFSAYGDTDSLVCVATSSDKELFPSLTSANTLGIYPAASPAYPTVARFSEWRIVPDASGTSFAGAYSMPTNFIYAVPASSCGAAYPISGNPASSNFDMQFAPIIYSVGGIKISCAGEKFVTRQFYFDWNAQCSGQATISTCGSASGFDCAIQVFPLDVCSDDACSAADGCSLSCNDNCSSSIYGGSKVTFTAEAGRKYLVRLMALGVDPATSGWSLGSISFSCINVNPNCCSPNWGQTCCSDISCCALVCEADPYCCTTEWDQICADTALLYCPSCGGTTPFSADINNDGLVDSLDLTILLGQWGTSGF